MAVDIGSLLQGLMGAGQQGSTMPYMDPTQGNAPDAGGVLPTANPAPAQAPQQGPVTDPQQIQKNKGLWQQFLGQMHDPNVRQSLFMAGANMLRSPKWGENRGDVIANGLTQGFGTLQSLKNQDTADKLKAQEEADRQAQIQISRQNAGTEAARASTYAQATGNENTYRQGELASTNTRQAEEARHNKAAEGTAGVVANADMIKAQADADRAKAYAAGTAGKTPQEIQKINMLAEQFIAEGADPTEAHARAVMMLDVQGKSKSPGEQARMLYQQKLTQWGNDISNFGKQLTRQQAQGMMDDAVSEVTRLQDVDRALTGAPRTSTNSGGPIARPGAQQPTGPKPGDVVNGYKFSGGDPKDKSNWTKVSGNNGK